MNTILSQIKVSYKMMMLSGILLLGLVGLALVSATYIQKIGTKIADIAEVDLPITKGLTGITLHQLEQAIHFERMIFFGNEIKTTSQAKEKYEEEFHKFEKLTHKVDQEMVRLEKLIADQLKQSHSAEVITEFTGVLSKLKKIEQAHLQYEQSVERIHQLIMTGFARFTHDLKIQTAYMEEELDGNLIHLLEEVENFTEKSALEVEHYEQYALKVFIALSLFFIALGIISTLLLSRNITGPLISLTGVLQKITQGVLDVTVGFDKRKDEFGEIARATKILLTKTIENVALNKKAIEQEETAKKDMKTQMLKLSDDIEENMQKSIEGILERTAGVLQAADEMLETAKNVGKTSDEVLQATESATNDVNSVASAAEELTTSIQDISQQLDGATKTTQRSVDVSKSSMEKFASLSEAVKSIGSVIEIISDIAEKTNLLALNATIESARAGEAGKGFAVVADEVKSLANQTSDATENITRQIKSIQENTNFAVESMKEIFKNSEEINEISGVIAGSIGEQNTVSEEISKSTIQAAKNTSHVVEQIKALNKEFSSSEGLAENIKTSIARVLEDTEGMRENTQKVLRESYAGDRRQHKRYFPGSTISVQVDGSGLTGTLMDISAEGARIQLPKENMKSLKNAQQVQISPPGYKALSGKLLQVQDGIVRMSFTQSLEESGAFSEYLKKTFGHMDKKDIAS